MPQTRTDAVTVGRAYVDALASKDRAALMSLFDREVDFRGLTPSDEWRAAHPEEVAEVVLGSWFEPTDHIREVVDVEVQPIADDTGSDIASAQRTRMGCSSSSSRGTSVSSTVSSRG